jgi:hypothetical protein
MHLNRGKHSLEILDASGQEIPSIKSKQIELSAVRHESPSQFSREYRRMFGAPPRENVAALTAVAALTGHSGV